MDQLNSMRNLPTKPDASKPLKMLKYPAHKNQKSLELPPKLRHKNSDLTKSASSRASNRCKMFENDRHLNKGFSNHPHEISARDKLEKIKNQHGGKFLSPDEKRQNSLREAQKQNES